MAVHSAVYRRHTHEAKVRKYGDRCATEGLDFVPLAVDSFGGWHEVALQTLTKLGRQLARVVGKPEAEQVLHLRHHSHSHHSVRRCQTMEHTKKMLCAKI
jgi:hypothetical protein